MAYVQHTHCVNTNDYVEMSAALLGVGGAFAALGLVLALIGGSVLAGPAMAFGALLILMAACNYLLGGKLICLEHDKCAIGRVMGLEPPGFNKPFPENIDNDYSVNILLAPQLPGVTEAEAQANKSQGHLITKQWQVSAHSDLDFQVYKSEDVNKKNDKSPVLHCEFEGDRIYYVCATAEAALAAFTVISFVCGIPVIGWIICLIAALIALIAVGIAWAASAGGDPADAGLTDGELVVDRDYIVIRGDWCFDTGHSPGWNEFHPVKYVQRLNDPDDPNWKPPWVEVAGNAPAAAYALFTAFLDEWCHETKKPEDPHTKDEQRDPKNRWCLHPVVDGCEDEDPVPVPK